jgi:iron complex transport system substrate-binding protein
MEKIMQQKFIRILFYLLLASAFLVGCTTPATDELPPIDPVEEPQPVLPEEELPEPEIEEIPLDEEEDARFTIVADADLIPAISALYEAFFTGESPRFVEEDGDLTATSAPTQTLERPAVLATFLPGAVLIPEVENEDVRAFVEFAVSTEGQQTLIDAGELPAVITLTDLVGNIVEIKQPVNRVISAYGPTTSMIYAVNAGARLVSASYLGARDPQGAAAMERIDPRFPDLIGDAYFTQQDFNVEFAATLEPDLVIAGARSPWADSVKQLGIEVFLVEAETPEQLKQAMLLIGQIFGPNSHAQAQAWVAYYEQIVAQVLEQTGEIPSEERVQVLFTGTEPLRVASGDMYQTDIINAAGGFSVSSELRGFWNDINIEQVVIWNPQVIIVPPYGGASVEAIIESTEWQILDSVQTGRVYRMPKLVVPWDTPAPDSVLGIIWLAERLNPLLIGITCGEEAAYFYRAFYNYEITGEEIASICIIE